jgi:putative sugar O-methyltransferase
VIAKVLGERGMSNLRKQIRDILGQIDIAVIKKSSLNKLREEAGRNNGASFKQSALPEGTEEYLRADNPRLQELRSRYANHPAADHSLWATEFLDRELKLPYFRGDNAYVFQTRRATEASYILSAYHVKSADKLNLLSRLQEDDLFGNFTFNFNDELTVSRDLLDSVMEINFLDQEIGITKIPDFTVLDIGAGYGRLAHRLVTGLPNVRSVFCTDSVAESTFISEYYLRFRKVDERAKVIPLDEIENVLTNNPVQLATNIHSFSECTLSAITWWLDLVARHKVRYLFIVPNNKEFTSCEKNGARSKFLPEITERGYRLKASRPKYDGATSVQRLGVFPSEFYLFELSA